MRSFKVTLEYDGTGFAGFQYQLGQRSVQAEVERAVERIAGCPCRVHGAGRTDAGVHALGQVVSFQAETRIPIERMASALNSALPRDVAAVAAEETNAGFHARFSATARAYVYVVLNRECRSAVFDRYVCHFPHRLDVIAMRAGARRLVGWHDFTSWANDTRETNSTVREVTHCSVRQARQFILLRIRANAFLRGMVRNIAGTLLEVGSGKRAPDDMPRITAAKDRSIAGPSAPARGLCLVRVWYNGPKWTEDGGPRTDGD